VAMNMSYCRFENTLAALHECEYVIGDPTDDLSEYERSARSKLLVLCKQIADDFEEEIEEWLEAKKQRRVAAQKVD
jgi:hypothetical protein